MDGGTTVMSTKLPVIQIHGNSMDGGTNVGEGPLPGIFDKDPQKLQKMHSSGSNFSKDSIDWGITLPDIRDCGSQSRRGSVASLHLSRPSMTRENSINSQHSIASSTDSTTGGGGHFFQRSQNNSNDNNVASKTDPLITIDFDQINEHFFMGKAEKRDRTPSPPSSHQNGLWIQPRRRSTLRRKRSDSATTVNNPRRLSEGAQQQHREQAKILPIGIGGQSDDSRKISEPPRYFGSQALKYDSNQLHGNRYLQILRASSSVGVKGLEKIKADSSTTQQSPLSSTSFSNPNTTTKVGLRGRFSAEQMNPNLKNVAEHRYGSDPLEPLQQTRPAKGGQDERSVLRPNSYDGMMTSSTTTSRPVDDLAKPKGGPKRTSNPDNGDQVDETVTESGNGFDRLVTEDETPVAIREARRRISLAPRMESTLSSTALAVKHLTSVGKKKKTNMPPISSIADSDTSNNVLLPHKSNVDRRGVRILSRLDSEKYRHRVCLRLDTNELKEGIEYKNDFRHLVQDEMWHRNPRFGIERKGGNNAAKYLPDLDSDEDIEEISEMIAHAFGNN